MIIRSFRRVMKIQRRVHHIPLSPNQHWEIPYPNGVALRTGAYFAAILTAMVFLSHLILVGTVLSIIPAGGRYVVIPAVLTWVVVSKTFDGRTPHRWLWSALCYMVRHKTRSADRKVPSEVSWSGRVQVAHDVNAYELHKARIHGPSTVRFAVPVRFRLGWWGRGFVAYGHRDGQLAEYEVDERLEVRP